MKKLTVSLFAIAILLCLTFIANFVSAEQGKITSTATESKLVAPDTATVNFTVETTDKNSQKAVELNNQQMKTITETIKSALSTKDSVKTANYSLRQTTEYNNLLKKNVTTGYIVTNTITVTLKDTSKMGKIIGIATKNGATKLTNFGFSLQNTDPVCKELSEKAVKKARAEATSILAPLGKTIDSVASISYNCSTHTNYNPYRNYNEMTKAMSSFADTAENINIEQGESKVEATVTIVFTIK